MKFKLIVEATLPDDINDVPEPEWKTGPEDIKRLLEEFISGYRAICEKANVIHGIPLPFLHEQVSFKVLAAEKCGGCGSPCSSHSI